MAGAYKIEEEIASYACKMCRMKLFTSENLLEHEPQQHQIAARKKVKDIKQKGHQLALQEFCSSYFLVDTMDWMDQDLLDQGKLMCPNAKCQSRIGTFSWSGSQCSCGTWVTPSIKLIKSKVDHVYSRSHVRIIQGVIIQPTITNIERQEQAEDISIEESQAY